MLKSFVRNLISFFFVPVQYEDKRETVPVTTFGRFVFRHHDGRYGIFMLGFTAIAFIAIVWSGWTAASLTDALTRFFGAAFAGSVGGFYAMYFIAQTHAKWRERRKEVLVDQRSYRSDPVRAHEHELVPHWWRIVIAMALLSLALTSATATARLILDRMSVPVVPVATCIHCTRSDGLAYEMCDGSTTCPFYDVDLIEVSRDSRDASTHSAGIDPRIGMACSAGVGGCMTNGTWIIDGDVLMCTARAHDPTTETCDNVDNDCDGSFDERLIRCGLDGQQECHGGEWITTMPFQCDTPLYGNWVDRDPELTP